VCILEPTDGVWFSTIVWFSLWEDEVWGLQGGGGRSKNLC